jgi:hypothetical protein
MKRLVRKYWCPLSPTDACQYGGVKRFDDGFVRGTRPFCFKVRRWIRDRLTGRRIECPIANKELGGKNPDTATECSP